MVEVGIKCDTDVGAFSAANSYGIAYLVGDRFLSGCTALRHHFHVHRTKYLFQT